MRKGFYVTLSWLSCERIQLRFERHEHSTELAGRQGGKISAGGWLEEGGEEGRETIPFIGSQADGKLKRVRVL